jgi:hypothetical protein
VGVDMLSDIGINLISDVIFILLGLLIFWLYYLLSNRKRLLKFFGITKTKKITIYLSKLNIVRGGSKGFDGTHYSFQGSSIAYEESKAATQLQSLFNYFLPSQVEKPELLRKLLIADIDVKIIASPSEENAIEQNTTIISIGLPPYNIVSRNIESSWRLSAKFGFTQSHTVLESEDNEKGHIVTPSGVSLGTAVPLLSATPSGVTAGSVVPVDDIVTSASSLSSKQSTQPIITIQNIPPYTDNSIGFVQRIFDSENKRNLFYIAGLSENSTAGCAYYLVDNWQKLFKKYGDATPFLGLLKIDNNNNKLHEIIMEK